KARRVAASVTLPTTSRLTTPAPTMTRSLDCVETIRRNMREARARGYSGRAPRQDPPLPRRSPAPPPLGVQQAQPQRELHVLVPVAQAQLVLDPLLVRVHRLRRDEQALANLRRR